MFERLERGLEDCDINDFDGGDVVARVGRTPQCLEDLWWYVELEELLVLAFGAWCLIGIWTVLLLLYEMFLLCLLPVEAAPSRETSEASMVDGEA